jgi:uncharacterized Tic20 family protein
MTDSKSAAEADGKRLAVISEGLYLFNLLFPVIPLLGLGWIYSRHRGHEIGLVRNHLGQAFFGATIATTIFLAGNALILLLGGYHSISALIIFEVYFIIVVPLFLIPGLLGLIKAMASQHYRYPLIGRFHAG